MRKTLTDNGVTALKPRAQRYARPDPELRGHYVRVQPSGVKSFAAVTRDPRGKQVWTTIGDSTVLSIDEARKRARSVIERIRAGLPAFEVPPNTPEAFKEVAENWLKRHVKAKGLRSEKQIERYLKVLVYDTWGALPFVSIRRSDVAELLDTIVDNNGARQADCVLTIVRSMMNWYAARHDDYSPPIVRGMRRQSAKEQARDRILGDDEIRVIWKAAEGSGTFGAFVRMALLTAQRRAKVTAMKRDDIADGEWTIPKEPREKDNAGWLVLPQIARDIIDAQPQLGENPYVFAGRGNGAFNGYSKLKRRFDSKLPLDDDGESTVAAWQIHDLRRTARSLMSRAGVRPDIAERVMGHAIAGVEGVYDRHQYRDEKADALRRLAALIDGVVNPRANVVALPTRKKPLRQKGRSNATPERQAV